MPERRSPLNKLLALGLTLLTAGCTASGEDFGIRLDSIEARAVANGVNVRARQDVRLSPEARKALRHGVPLKVTIELSVRGKDRVVGAGGRSFDYEIRYLPLSEHYQLAGPGGETQTRTYPRLRHVLAALGDVRLRLEDTASEPGHYELRMRSRLDRSNMPGPMQLPVYLSSQWVHDSGWVSSPFETGG
jgi:hypothetical protein